MLLSAVSNLFSWDSILEYIGYISSVLILLSFVMTSVVKLRWVSAIGSALFSVYGFLIGSIPTGLTNAGVVLANIYHLIRMKKHEDLFSAHSIRIENEFLNSFILFNGKDIQKYFGNFSLQGTDANVAILVYCNMTCAGLLVGKDLGGGRLRIDLDYATPEYRDCRVGKFLYQKLAEMNFHTLTATSDNAKHIQYLTSMGFAKKDGAFEKKL